MNHVPPAVRRAVSDVIDTDRVRSLRPAVKYHGATLRLDPFKGLSHGDIRNLREAGAEPGGINVDTDGNLRVHLRPMGD